MPLQGVAAKFNIVVNLPVLGDAPIDLTEGAAPEVRCSNQNIRGQRCAQRCVRPASRLCIVSVIYDG